MYSAWKNVAPSPSEIASIIQASKQAALNVLIAQQRVQAAKDNVLNLQKMAQEKEAQASLVHQKNAASVALHR